MDQSTFTNLTGVTLTDSQVSRFGSVALSAGEAIEEALGWPLDPSDWGNQYLEIGKTRSEWWSCSCVDTSDLDDPDAVEGKTRLYTWRPTDPYLTIDPATALHKVKLVRSGITYKTFDASDYSLRLVNGRTPYGRYVEFCDDLFGWFWGWWGHLDTRSLVASGTMDGAYLQVAVDGDWAFAKEEDGDLTLPRALQQVWADLIAYRLDLKRDVKSESILSHSYSRNAKVDPLTTADHKATLAKYAGPNGTAYPKGLVL